MLVFSFLPSKFKYSIADKVARQVLKKNVRSFKEYTWLDSRSDEIQFCSPGIDLPVASLMRTKYGEYPEYHTSKDDLNLISSEGLFGSYQAISNAIQIIENNNIFQYKVIGEPNLGKRGLYPTIGGKNLDKDVKSMKDFLGVESLEQLIQK